MNWAAMFSPPPPEVAMAFGCVGRSWYGCTSQWIRPTDRRGGCDDEGEETETHLDHSGQLQLPHQRLELLRPEHHWGVPAIYPQRKAVNAVRAATTRHGSSGGGGE